MRTLVIPDLHNNVEWVRPFLERTSHDEVVFLGDYFDDFGDGPKQAHATALWLRDALEIPKSIFLLGNHDLPYRFPENESLACPGFDHAKLRAVSGVLGPEHWDRMKLFHVSQGWLVSHAGISEFLFGRAQDGLSIETLQVICDNAVDIVRAGGFHRAFSWGADRGGPHPFGGITWQCWSSFRPIPGWNQIVGHTPDHRVLRRKGPDSDNYCIDTLCQHAAIIEDGRVTVQSTGVRR